MIRMGMPGGFGGGGGGPVIIGGPATAAAANPIARILEMRETLGLTDLQRAQLDSISEALVERQRAFQESLREEMMRAFQRDPQNAMQALQPRLVEARQQLVDALAEARAVLTPEQWSQLPTDVTEPPAIPSGLNRRGAAQRTPGGGSDGAGGGAGGGAARGGTGGQGQIRQVRPNP